MGNISNMSIANGLITFFNLQPITHNPSNMKFVSCNQEKQIEKTHIDLQHSATSLFSKRVLRTGKERQSRDHKCQCCPSVDSAKQSKQPKQLKR